MVASFASNPFNHILRNESWACRRLQCYEGKTACIRIPPFLSFQMVVLANGELSHCPDNLEADVTLSILPGILPGLIARDESAYDNIQITGDVIFAEDLIAIGKHLKPDFEQQLSRIIGDIPAHRLTEAGTAIFQWQINTVKNLSDAFGEYWLEEQPLIAKSNAIKDFSCQIEALQRNVDQLEARINRITQRGIP